MGFLIDDIMHAPFWIAALQIIGVNIILSGDNAVVIALACLSLPPRQRLWGMIIGAGVAVLLPEWLRFAESYYLIIYALVVMLMMALCPTGVVGLIERLLTPRRRPHADDKGALLDEAKP